MCGRDDDRWCVGETWHVCIDGRERKLHPDGDDPVGGSRNQDSVCEGGRP